MKLFWRLVTPSHPRGWIEVDWEEQPDGNLRVFTEGLERFDLPDLEILDCPADRILLGYMHGMLFVATGALQLSNEEGRPIRDKDILDLRTEEEEEPAQVRILQIREGIFRLEDLDAGPNRFPSAATANYVLNSADRLRRADKLLDAAILASEIHAKAFSYDVAPPDDDDWMDVIKQMHVHII
ncbi:MAG: hypothetical protein AAF557_06910 [Pseudomonadota bacterium]